MHAQLIGAPTRVLLHARSPSLLFLLPPSLLSFAFAPSPPPPSSSTATSDVHMMPFERYLQHQPSQSSSDGGYSHSSNSHQQGNTHSNNNNNYDPHDGQLDPATFSRPVQFQMPQFMYTGPPTLAQGGGAEVLPAGIFSSPGAMSSLAGSQWFQNSGFGKTGEQMCVWSFLLVTFCAFQGDWVIVRDDCRRVARLRPSSSLSFRAHIAQGS